MVQAVRDIQHLTGVVRDCCDCVACMNSHASTVGGETCARRQGAHGRCVRTREAGAASRTAPGSTDSARTVLRDCEAAAAVRLVTLPHTG